MYILKWFLIIALLIYTYSVIAAKYTPPKEPGIYINSKVSRKGHSIIKIYNTNDFTVWCYLATYDSYDTDIKEIKIRKHRHSRWLRVTTDKTEWEIDCE